MFCLENILNSGKHFLWFASILTVSISIHPLMTSFGNPIVGYDALAYHTYLPWFAMTESHSLRTDLLVPNSGLSLGAQGIFGLYQSIFGYKFVNLINFFFLFATLHLVYLYAQNDKRVVRLTKSLAALVVIISAGRIVVTSPSSDLALLFYACVSTILTIRIVYSGYRLNTFWLFSLGGFIFFIKPFGIILTAFLLYMVARSTKMRPTKVLVFFTCGFSMSFSWAIYNYYYTGNPFFPLFQGFFKGIGFGPEVMTNEEDVRRSFTQTFTYLNSNEIKLFDLQIIQIQIFFVLGIALLSLVVLLWNLLQKKTINVFVAFLNLTFLFLLLYIGPIFRYFIFISVLQVFFLFSDIHVVNSKNITLRKKRILKKVESGRLSQSLASGLFICLCLFSLRGTVAEYGVNDMEPPKTLIPSGITVNEKGFRDVVDFLAQKNFDGSRLAILGEGRAALFYPKPTLVLPGDRRNPFFDPNVVTVSAIRNRLYDFDVDYLLIATSWGWPKNANVNLIEDFRKLSQESLVFTSEGWEVYEI
jgi:hypothetical protein